MKNRLIALAVLLSAALSSGGWLIQSTSTYLGPGDLWTYTAWHSCARAYTKAVALIGTQKMCRIRNTTSNEQCDIMPARSGAAGRTANCSAGSAGVSVSTFCGGVDCALVTAYNQAGTTPCAGGTACDVTQATAGNQPLLVAADSYMSAKVNGSTAKKLLSANNYTPNVSALQSYTAVGQKTGLDTGAFMSMTGLAGLSGASTVTNHFQLQAVTPVTSTMTLADSAWHTVGAVYNGVANGTGFCATLTACTFASTTAAARTTAGPPQILGLSNGSNTLQWRESGWTDNFVMTTTQAQNYNLQSATFYGFIPP